MNRHFAERFEQKRTEFRDSMQVCLNGHILNAFTQLKPEKSVQHCHKCGAKGIVCCPKCNAAIPGGTRAAVGAHMYPRKPGLFCVGCGTPYPWRAALEAEEAQSKLEQKTMIDMTSDTRMIIDDAGSKVTIRRNNQDVSSTKAVIDAKLGYLLFDPITDIRDGDDVLIKASGDVCNIERVEKLVSNDEFHSIHAHFRKPFKSESGTTISIGGNLSNAVIQTNSPQAQAIVGSFNSDQQGQIGEVIAMLNEILDSLPLAADDKDEVRGDSEAVEHQLKQKKPKWDIVRTCLKSLRGHVVKALDGKIADTIKDKVSWVYDQLNGLCG